ncbi:MAG: aminotransferase class I/II-fold pyridoxal phosphate-dependent enzyme, partial [Bdellovibrionota bacterium]
AKHRSVLEVSHPRAAELGILVDGVSKAYAMTGWRIGWAVGPKDVIGAMNVTKPTAHPLGEQFAGAGILKETTGKEKNRIFSFQEYIALFDSQQS